MDSEKRTEKRKWDVAYGETMTDGFYDIRTII